MEAQAVVALVIGIVVVLFVPALVWSTAIAGLYQVMRRKIQTGVKAIARKAPASAK
jgi:hypothetical protein